MSSATFQDSETTSLPGSLEAGVSVQIIVPAFETMGARVQARGQLAVEKIVQRGELIGADHVAIEQDAPAPAGLVLLGLAFVGHHGLGAVAPGRVPQVGGAGFEAQREQERQGQGGNCESVLGHGGFLCGFLCGFLLAI